MVASGVAFEVRRIATRSAAATVRAPSRATSLEAESRRRGRESPVRVEGRCTATALLGLRLPDAAWTSFAAGGESARRGPCRPPRHLHVTLAFLGGGRARARGTSTRLRRPPRRGPLAFRGGRYRETRSVGMLVLDDRGDGRLRSLSTSRPARAARPLPARGPPLASARHRARFRSGHGCVRSCPSWGTFVPSDAAVFLSVCARPGRSTTLSSRSRLGG